MHLRRLKLRFRRKFRLRQRQAELQLEHNVLRRFGHLSLVRRFVVAWMLLLLLVIGCLVAQIRALGGYYQTLQPAPGGTYTEGVIGNYTNVNPLYVSGQVNDAVSRLVFAGLFTYNDRNHLVGDLAHDLSVDPTGEVYTVHLRPNLTWQDGAPLTANDVVFTYQTIQNPDAQSPLNESWQDVTVSAPSPYTVVFRLPNPLSSFPYSLTTGIIPQHILGHVPMDELRSANFNTIQPVGAGPFALRNVQVQGDTPGTRQEEVALQPFAQYHGGKPRLSSFVVHAFSGQQQMLASFNKQEINSMVGLTSLPQKLKDDKSVRQYNMPLTAANMTFFKTTNGVLADAKVRRALIAGANVPQIIQQLGFGAKAVTEPLLQSQLGFNAKYEQSGYNPATAVNILARDGWQAGADGVLQKNGQPLTFGLYAQNNSEDAHVANALQKQWRSLGANVQIYLQDTTDFQATVAYHNYDALLYGISIGVDPDTFVYWDSSQADVRSPTRLNFSEWSNPTADAALEAGRTRSDSAERVIKYQPFLRAWQQDAPALGLYQPRFLYVTRGPVFGLNQHAVNTDTDRYDNVQSWEIREVPTTDKQ